jgi:TRIAD3 protein (E3 ubiquitin-protein ligase RNF216)
MLAKDIIDVLKSNSFTLYASYLDLVEKEASDTCKFKKHPTKRHLAYDEELDETIKNTHAEPKKMALEEFKVARLAAEYLRLQVQNEKRQKQEEVDNFEKARAEGTTSECGCCFDEFPLNRMVHCNGMLLHWFCRDCARQMAETQIGLSKFELSCMSMDVCTAGFSKDQRDVFLDEKTAIALERIEQEAALRMAGIKDLETCPFCPYAAEYPPIEVDKEFRCERAECEIVSCRLCRKETHIPKTCEEAAREAGHSGRRIIEEAMSAALIRNCNKCES